MKKILFCILASILVSIAPAGAQSFFHCVDSILTLHYYKSNIDTTYVTRPATKWTLRARFNVSGTQIESEGLDNDLHFKSMMRADNKMTLSLGASYLGISLSASINPAKLWGKYRDTELSFNTYGRRFGFDFVYQNARNFTGWYEADGMERFDIPEDALIVKTLNVNAYYCFNSRRFSYPAALSQSYIQRR